MLLGEAKFLWAFSLSSPQKVIHIFVMMLGTNDILLTYDPNVELAVTKLDRILSYVKENCKTQFILISPPYIKVIEPEMQRYHNCCIEMNQRFLELAKQYGIPAINASEWNIEMGSDGVHFSIEGHKRFAECFIKSRYWRENRID